MSIREDLEFWWRTEPAAVLVTGALICATVGGLLIWYAVSLPRAGFGINIPHQWTCHSKYDGGYCERTGGVDRNGRPWGTATPKFYKGRPTTDAAARMAMTSPPN